MDDQQHQSRERIRELEHAIMEVSSEKYGVPMPSRLADAIDRALKVLSNVADADE